MPALICGSLAFDTITTFPGRFADQILPDQVHILNVSFLVPTLRREFGGCAGNIAYNLQLLGGAPVVLGALGVDGSDYLARLQGWGADVSLIHRDGTLHTAQCNFSFALSVHQQCRGHGAWRQRHPFRIGGSNHDLVTLAAETRRQHLALLSRSSMPPPCHCAS